MGTGGMPAGWYDDGRGAMRWWDGERWTDVMAPPAGDALTAPPWSADGGTPTGSGTEPPPAQSAASPAAATPRSRLGWIVGGAALAAAALIAVVIAVGVLPGPTDRMDVPAEAGESRAGRGSSPTGSPTPAVDQAAIEAIALLDAAWVEGDCDLYFASTTSHFRDYMTIRTCPDFESRAEQRSQAIVSNVWTVATSEQPNAVTAIVVTHNFVESLVNVDGETVEPPAVIETDYAHHLEKQVGEWKVDEVHDVTDGRAEWAVTADEEAAAQAAADSWVAAITTGDCGAAQAAMTLDFATRNGFAPGDGWGGCAGLEQHVRERDATCAFSVRTSDIVYNSRVDGHLGEILVTTVESCGGERIVELHLVDVGDAGWRVSDVLDETTER